MPANSGFDPEKIHIYSIKILKAQIESPLEFDDDQVNGYKIHMGLKLASNVEESRIKAELDIQVVTDSSEGTNKSEAEGAFHFAYIFHIENFRETSSISEDGHVTLDEKMSNAVASISYSTARGILLTRFQGTSLASFILPVINPNSLFEDSRIQPT